MRRRPSRQSPAEAEGVHRRPGRPGERALVTNHHELFLKNKRVIFPLEVCH